ncbi:hypothetical protein F7R91_25790 [Streptomyces luteolifulvus]|uniref:Uncharacterized protein n=1 Tax=Streptomyces luteolifulvus TaxID=2615112 RepID=A0A6H9UW76_9ACTN|nr:hypothetical protein [Streptomyces luteolifulvus]KAB1143222.1 hypothetical protein F7R91_25790 [Streptomyces luteolifulvus]
MTYRFVARAAGAQIDLEDDCFIEAGIAEEEDGDGFIMLFQCRAGEPDEQDVSLGLDTPCVGQSTAARRDGGLELLTK